MKYHLLGSMRHRIFGLLCLLILLESQVVVGNRAKPAPKHISRAIKSRNGQPRQTKFSPLGIFGIRSGDKSTAKIKGTYIGVIPDAGDTGGKAQTMHEIIESLKGKRPACFGWYAQVRPGHAFKGEQLFEVLPDLKNCSCVFSPTIMPGKSWEGFRYKDDYQAVAIAKVLRNFTDMDIPVILRFAHEANWYQRTGEYVGTAKDFREAWHVVAKAVRRYCPDCLLHWTPNVEKDINKYKDYEPPEMDLYVDLVGFDWYNEKKPKEGDFLRYAQPFHDKYAVNGRKFAMGEAGLHYRATYEERVDWLDQMASSKEKLHELVFINWYNSQKEYDYKIAGKGVSTALLTAKLE